MNRYKSTREYLEHHLALALTNYTEALVQIDAQIEVPPAPRVAELHPNMWQEVHERSVIYHTIMLILEAVYDRPLPQESKSEAVKRVRSHYKKYTPLSERTQKELDAVFRYCINRFAKAVKS